MQESKGEMMLLKLAQQYGGVGQRTDITQQPQSLLSIRHKGKKRIKVNAQVSGQFGNRVTI